MKEIWKDISGYDGLYQISNLGNIKSLYNNNIYYMKHHKNNRGYLMVRLNDGLKQIHRLVAKEFLENKDNKPQINHIDGNKSNNVVSNLEWCTNSENIKHSWDTGLRSLQNSYHRGKYNVLSKCVIQYDTNGCKVKEWECINDVQRTLGIDHRHISRVCRGKRKTTGGYIWRYKE